MNFGRFRNLNKWFTNVRNAIIKQYWNYHLWKMPSEILV